MIVAKLSFRTFPSSRLVRISASSKPRIKRRVRRLACLPREEPQEMNLRDLQARLSKAIQREDYAKAAQLRDVIADKELDVRLAVEYVNRRFYDAFQRAQLEEMREIWSDAEHVQCIHPLQDCIATHRLVIESWREIFSSIIQGTYEIRLEDVRIYVSGNVAIVTCVEAVTSGGDTGRIFATNIFENVDNTWKIILHHGSPLRQF